MIDFKDVSFSYPDGRILTNVNFHMKDGEFVAILGPNGGGKSTFLKLVLSLLKPTSGKIEVKERRISYISQMTSLGDSSFPATVREVVSFGLVNCKPRLNNREKNARIEAILAEMHLKDIEKKIVNELSGGQLQRVKVAKALISEPSLLVLDEPDAGMDEESHHQLLDLVEELRKKKTSILFVSHHPEDVKNANAIYFIEDGKMLTYEEELRREHRHVIL